MQVEGGAGDLERVLDGAPFGPHTRLVCVLASLALVFDGFDIQAIAFAAPRLLAEWHLDRSDLAFMLAAGLLGMGLGALLLGAAGDRYGRRPALLGCMSLIAAASLFAAVAASRDGLAFCRFLTGLGLGGALPNAAALMVEFAPARWRNVAVAATVVGVPIGGSLGSIVAGALIPRFGWPSVFMVGAVLPALLALVMWRWLAESPRFLSMQPRRQAELLRLLARIAGVAALTGAERWRPAESACRPGLRAVFAPEYRRNTLLIWVIFFSNVLAVYSYFNWTPTLLTGAGLSLTTALRGAFLFNLGGVVAGVAGAALMSRFGSRAVLVAFAASGVASTLAIGLLPIGPSAAELPLFALLFLAGACISGLQVNMYSIAAYTYPTQIRSTGVGSALGFARPGGILSSYAGPVLLAFGGGLATFFTGVAAVLAVTLLGVLLLRSHLPPPAERSAP
jgi:AAHS family 4-hydroxybenzoate transporter-like MFS transporter